MATDTDRIPVLHCITGMSEKDAHELAVDLIEDILSYNRGECDAEALGIRVYIEDYQRVALRRWVEAQGLHRIL